MVYLWCDGQELEFQKRKEKYLKECKKNYCNLSAGDIRFFDNDELKYSLRSLEKNAPWINHIYIVTDRQVPRWLNLNCPRVSIIDHSLILPSSIIPCFNSSVIERYIGFIPNLKEHFLYGNDDTFFGEPVSQDFFFRDGKPIVRLIPFNHEVKTYDQDTFMNLKESASFWGKSVYNSWNLLAASYSLKTFQMYETHHNIDAFSKTAYCECYEKYKSILEKHINRFRSEDDFQRILFSMDAVFSSKAKSKILHEYSKPRKYLFWLKQLHLDSYCIEDKRRSLLALRCIHPKLFCINNSDRIDFKDKKYEKQFLDYKFPNKSSFEI